MTNQQTLFQALFTLPNLLTSLRFVSTPFLLWLAWSGYGTAFLVLLAITFLSDVLDGMAARMLHQESEIGALLDSWADIVIYSTIAISAWWLWPEMVRREYIYVWVTVLSYLLPVIVGIIKFHAFTSYHTWAVKYAVSIMGLSFFLLVIFNFVWLFRIAAFICLLAAIEEMLISIKLSELRSNVRSLWHVMKEQSR